MTVDPQYRASAASPFAANCDGVAPVGTLFANAEVEPFLAVNPRNTQNLVAVWQQDRWSNGGARGIVSGASFDGGKTWSQRASPFTRCGGGNAGNGGNYPRASNPWAAFSADGVAYQIALGFSGQVLTPGSTSSILLSRSVDGGRTWGGTTTLIADGGDFFNDKVSITAHPTDGRFVYAAWDRLSIDGHGPAYFARTSDGGLSWETPRPIYDPGLNNQTIANIVAVLPNGTLVYLLTELTGAANDTFTSALAVLRSTDNGLTWSAPIRIADMLGVGARNPDTNAPIRDSTLIAEIAVGLGGTLYVVWQDARFSNGARDAIALSRSDDGGLTWSAPVRINGNAAVPAFSPFVHVRGDGVIGVSYYDFRSNTADRATLPTDYWLTRSVDATTWQETRIAAPFDLDLAPLTTSPGAGGRFLGDYQGLASIGNLFVPLFIQTNAGTLANRTDVFSAPAVSVTAAVATMASEPSASTPEANASATVKAVPAPYSAMTGEFRQRVHDNIVRTMEQRVPCWRERAMQGKRAAVGEGCR